MDDSTSRSCRIEKMQSCHIEQISAIEQQCFSNPWSYDALLGELSNPLAVYYTALIDDNVVGYAGMHHIVDEGYINNVAVLENFRHQGVGKKLMNSLLKYCKENDMEFITLEVRKSNSSAIKFYEDLGFEEVGKRKKFYSNPTEDAYIMTKEF